MTDVISVVDDVPFELVREYPEAGIFSSAAVPDGAAGAGEPDAAAGAQAPAWRVGEQIEAWCDGVLRYRGIVDAVAAHLGVVWLRESGIGERFMFCSADTELRHPPAS